MAEAQDIRVTQSLHYGEGAFTLLTGRAEWAPYSVTATEKVHKIRDHMLATVHPNVDLAILGKTSAGRAAHYLLDIVNAPITWPEDNIYPAWQERRKLEARRRYNRARAAHDLFEGHQGRGITFINPQRIIEVMTKRTTPATASFIVAYVKAITAGK